MAPLLTDIDAHEQPPLELKASWKRHSKCHPKDIDNQEELDDLSNSTTLGQFRVARQIPRQAMREAYLSLDPSLPAGKLDAIVEKCVYYHPILPGLLFSQWRAS